MRLDLINSASRSYDILMAFKYLRQYARVWNSAATQTTYGTLSTTQLSNRTSIEFTTSFKTLLFMLVHKCAQPQTQGKSLSSWAGGGAEASQVKIVFSQVDSRCCHVMENILNYVYKMALEWIWDINYG